MTYGSIDAHRTRIDRVIARAKALDPGDPVRGDLAQHVCILVSGYIEQTVKSLVLVHCSNRGVPATVERYVRGQLRRYFQSADAERIYALVGALDPSLEVALRAKLSPAQEAAITSVVRLRHQFAHGGQAGTSIARQESYRGLIEAGLVDLRQVLA